MSHTELKPIKKTIQKASNKSLAKQMAYYFKAHPGGYAAYDRFLGIRMPSLRQIAQQHRALGFEPLSTLLCSVYHEERMLALVILINQYQASHDNHQSYFDFYQRHIDHINHWDLIDLSAPRIVGHYLLSRDKKQLDTWVKSNNPWQRRIAVVATHHFILKQQYQHTLKLVHACMQDPVTLMHQACGWMLREVGKQDHPTLASFIEKHAKNMPRTMLRYAIEKWPVAQRKRILETTRHQS